jgi:hypothetical protein
MLASLPLMPEWYLGVLSLVLLGAVGLLWPPMVIALVAAGLGLLISVAQAGVSARRASFGMPNRARHETAPLRLITALLHLVQPVARLRGRLEYGLTPWRRRGVARLCLPIRQQYAIWTERWEAAEARLERVERGVRMRGALVCRGGCYDRWDLHARGGLLGGARLRMAIEEHGAGQQLLRFRVWPTIRATAVVVVFFLVALATVASRDGAPAAAVILTSLGMMVIVRSGYECAVAMSTVHETLGSTDGDEPVNSLADQQDLGCNRATADLGPDPDAGTEAPGATAR